MSNETNSSPYAGYLPEYAKASVGQTVYYVEYRPGHHDFAKFGLNDMLGMVHEAVIEKLTSTILALKNLDEGGKSIYIHDDIINFDVWRIFFSKAEAVDYLVKHYTKVLTNRIETCKETIEKMQDVLFTASAFHFQLTSLQEASPHAQ